jgi:cation diffusion facilitator family transporter
MSKPATTAPLAPTLGLAVAEEATAAPEFTAHERHQARRLLAVLLLVGVFFCAQLAGAIWADSDVLRAEALHLLTDVAALGMAFLAMRIAVRRPTERFTFGLRRAEPVAAIFNALLVLGATTFVVLEAIRDLERGAGPRADRMLYIAAMGIVVNGIAAWLIHGAIGGQDVLGHTSHDGHHHGDASPATPCEDHSHGHIAQQVRRRGHGHALNLRGAWLHLFGDALGALAAFVAAVSIRLGFSPKADPIASFVVAAILVYGGVRLLRDAVLILLEASPPHLLVDHIRLTILGISGVAHLHDLHVWTLGAGHEAITAHVTATLPDHTLAARIEEALRRHFQVEYVTIQVEVGGVTCHAEPLEP